MLLATTGAQTEVERQLSQEVIGRVVQAVLTRSEPPVEEVINETLYHERLRLSRAAGPRAEEDRAFYARVRHELPRVSQAEQRHLLHELVTRYVDEICGHFDRRVYALTTRALPVGLTALLHSFSPKEVVSHIPDLPELPSMSDRLLIEGEVDSLLSLVQRGTVVLAPTHSSNLDSLLMGYAIYRMGLPPFAYGAGLNLFSSHLIGFFMHHLGAYTVDRTKTDPLYREALKEYATASLEHGQHNVYFPGGTRSRSGAVESHLKKGLLGTSVPAFRHNLLSGRGQPRIFIVPCTSTYPLVLEAETLIEDYLRQEGKGRYIIVDDEFSRLHRWIDFLRGLLALDLRIPVIIGKPLDPFGNDVDENGESYDPRGRQIDPARYLLVDGQLAADPERDAEYTRMLSHRLVEAYHRDTVALSTHILAFAFLELLRRRSPQLGLFRFLRSLGPETNLPLQEVESTVARLLEQLVRLSEQGLIRLSEDARAGDAAALTTHALESFATYHTTPVIQRRGSRLHVGDAELIFYYRNRLDHLRLLGAPRLVPTRREP